MKGIDIVPLRGGFGNQLFCWARGLQLEHEGRHVFYDRGAHLGRGYELDSLQKTRKIALPSRVWRRLVRGQAPYSNSLFELQVEDQRAEPQLYTKKAPITVHWGYWQSSDYFKQIRSTAVDEVSSWLELKSDSHPAVCRVHVRRGDYVTDAGAARTLGALPLEYYQEAINRMRDDGFHRFIVHTDDPSWVRSRLVGRDIELSTSVTARDDFRSLASASGIIMSNSSFSWWASFIASQREAAQVVGPKKWFADSELSSKRLMEESWTKI